MPDSLAKRNEFSYSARAMDSTRGVARLLREEHGQAMTEYILVAMVTVVPLLVLGVPFVIAIRKYLQGIYSFVGLPIP